MARAKRKPLRPLTIYEQQLAEQNFYMVERFLKEHSLPYDEWYDVVIFRYLRTVINWFERPELYQYSFVTIAIKAMRSAVYNERQKQRRRIKTVSLDAVVPGTEDFTFGDMVTRDNLNYIPYTTYGNEEALV